MPGDSNLSINQAELRETCSNSNQKVWPVLQLLCRSQKVSTVKSLVLQCFSAQLSVLLKPWVET